MGRLTPDEKRETLTKKKQALEAQLKALDARSKAQARKDDTRRKVIAGAVALEHMQRNPDDPLSVKLREIIARSVDARSRRLFSFLHGSQDSAAATTEARAG